MMEKRAEFHILRLKNIKGSASGEIRFEMPGKLSDVLVLLLAN